MRRPRLCFREVHDSVLASARLCFWEGHDFSRADTNARTLGFSVAKPWGDSERYDFILDNGRRLLRVQIKATDCLRAHAYETRATYTVGKGRAVYGPKDIDFLVAHIATLNVWYVLPVRACMPAPMLRFYPHRTANKLRLDKRLVAWRRLE